MTAETTTGAAVHLDPGDPKYAASDNQRRPRFPRATNPEPGVGMQLEQLRPERGPNLTVDRRELRKLLR